MSLYDAIAYGTRGLALGMASPLLSLRRRRYRRVSTVHTRAIPEAQPRRLEGYTDKPWYRTGEVATFYLQSPYASNTLEIQKLTRGRGSVTVDRITFGGTVQRSHEQAAQQGCHWEPTMDLSIYADTYRSGYYRALIRSDEATDEEERGSAITFMVQDGSKPRSRVAVIAPTATWVAYNPYGGLSLYHNEIGHVSEYGTASVYRVSSQRPNPALGYAHIENIHAVEVEANIFNYLDGEHHADLYPDYALEVPQDLAAYDVIVLAYHNEYVTSEAYSGLRQLVADGASLLCLGANQIYWEIERIGPGLGVPYDAIECRKDATPFSEAASPLRRKGRLWRHTRYPEDRYLGVRFSHPGTGTYAPYCMINPDHWLCDGVDLGEGDLFGLRGISPLPICGDETDSPSRLSKPRVEVIARGLNRADAVDGDYTVYRSGDPAWDGQAGGTIAWMPFSDTHGVLSTGAIQSGSGLGVDTVFTQIVDNFFRRVLGH